MRAPIWLMLGMLMAAAHTSPAAVEQPARPELSGHWVMDESASTLPPRPGDGPGRGGPPSGGPPPGGRPPAGPRGTPRAFELEQTAEHIVLREGDRPFRVLLLTRDRVVRPAVPAGTMQSEAHWEGEALVIDDLTRGGAARKQTWRLEPGEVARLVIVTRVAAEGERPAIEWKQVFTRARAAR